MGLQKVISSTTSIRLMQAFTTENSRSYKNSSSRKDTRELLHRVLHALIMLHERLKKEACDFQSFCLRKDRGSVVLSCRHRVRSMSRIDVMSGRDSSGQANTSRVSRSLSSWSLQPFSLVVYSKLNPVWIAASTLLHSISKLLCPYYHLAGPTPVTSTSTVMYLMTAHFRRATGICDVGFKALCFLEVPVISRM